MAEREGEDLVLGAVGVEREEDVRARIVSCGKAVVDGGREALKRVAPVVLLDLKGPVAHALLADGDVGGVARRGHYDRHSVELRFARF